MPVSHVEVDDEGKGKTARETPISSSQYSHEPWRCGWAMLGKLLSVVANISMDPEGAAGSMLFRGSSRCKASSYDILPPLI